MAEEIKDPEAPEPKEDKRPSPLMKEAMGRYGIEPEHVLSSKDYGKSVTIVTKGGVKVSYTKGDKVTELAGSQLHGQLPPKPKKK